MYYYICEPHDVSPRLEIAVKFRVPVTVWDACKLHAKPKEDNIDLSVASISSRLSSARPTSGDPKEENVFQRRERLLQAKECSARCCLVLQAANGIQPRVSCRLKNAVQDRQAR